ncbi:MAG: glycerophosphodiester phosphodiesterase [Acidimicrobiales bacterium]
MSALPSLLRPPVAFAHRGASAHAPENTLEAFALAVRLGASGLESDVWLTADGVAVLAHDGVVRTGRAGLRRRRIEDLPRRALPSHIPSLEELYATCGTSLELSLDVKDLRAAPAAIAVARAAGTGAEGRLWLCHPDWEQVGGWRALSGQVRLVDSTRIHRMRHGAERRAAQLQAAGIDAVNLHHSDWSGGLTTLFHRFGRFALAWDAQHTRVIDGLARMGIDGVYGDHVDRLLDGLGMAPV